MQLTGQVPALQLLKFEVQTSWHCWTDPLLPDDPDDPVLTLDPVFPLDPVLPTVAPVPVLPLVPAPTSPLHPTPTTTNAARNIAIRVRVSI
jgi:hypothetical protein